MALAVELGQRGITCVLVERHLDAAADPQGSEPDQSHARALLLLALRRRAARRARHAAGLPDRRRDRLRHADQPVLPRLGPRPQRSSDAAPACSDYYFQRNERLPQYCTEAVLRSVSSSCRRSPRCSAGPPSASSRTTTGASVTVVPSTNATSRSTAGRPTPSSRPTRTTSGPTSDACCAAGTWSAATAAARWCASSMGIDRGGRDFDQRMVLAVLRSKELHEFLKRFPPATTYRVHEAGAAGLLAVLRPHRRRRGLLLPRARCRSTPRRTTSTFSACCTSAAGFEFAGGVRPHRLLGPAHHGRQPVPPGARVHRRRRLPQHPPYGGFGLEHRPGGRGQPGLEARPPTLQGWGGDALLDSYDQERRPIFAETGEVMIAGGIERDREWLERYRPERDRAEFERAWAEFGGRGARGPGVRAALRGLVGGARARRAACAASTGACRSRPRPATTWRRRR